MLVEHYVRANVYGVGNSYYASRSDDFSDPEVLNPRDLPRQLAEVVQTLESGLESRPVSPLLAVSVRESEKSAFVAYGVWLPESDEFGRSGVSLIHAARVNISDVVRATGGLATLVGSATLLPIALAVGALARGTTSIVSFLKLLGDAFARSLPRRPAVDFGLRFAVPPVGPIVHDSSGASLAWLMQVGSHALLDEREWLVYDMFSADTGMVVTTSSVVRKLPEVRLSECLSMAAVPLSLFMGVERTVRRLPSGSPDEGAGASPAWEGNTRDSAIVQGLWRGVLALPPRGLGCTFDLRQTAASSYREVWLSSDNGNYRVSPKRLLGLEVNEISYNLTVRVRKFRKLYSASAANLFVLRAGLDKETVIRLDYALTSMFKSRTC